MPERTSSTDLMSRRITLLFAMAAGAAVANLYWAQPLLGLIASDLHVSITSGGWLVTAAQSGYFVGILLVVPLGDAVDRRRLTTVLTTCAALALSACALAPTFATLVIALGVAGVCSVSGQVLVPFAGDLSSDARRGRVVGTVVSGMLTGILLSRTVSGLVGEVVGWRALFAASAVVAALFSVALHRHVPRMPAKTRMGYAALLGSVVRVVASEPTVRWTMAITALRFGAFSLFWTSLTFLLSAPPFEYPVSVIGLFGLVGFAGALAAQRTGVLHDKGWSVPATGLACALMSASYLLAIAGQHDLALLLIAIVALDVAVQALSILNQARVFAVSHHERSRINTAVVTANFAGGIVGSAVAPVLWSMGGWTAVAVAAAAMSAVALALWAAGRKGPLATPLSLAQIG